MYDFAVDFGNNPQRERRRRRERDIIPFENQLEGLKVVFMETSGLL